MENKLVSNIRNHIIHVGLACVLCSALLGMPLVVHAQNGGPVPAHHFWGHVETDTGDPAPGVEITAWIDGEQKGSITTDSSGQYGSDPLTSTPFYLNVTGFNGDIIEFRVDGIAAEEVRWGVLIEEGTPYWDWDDKEPSFQVVYDSAEVNGLDLVYTPAAPPVPADAAAPASFTVSDLSVTPSDVIPAEQVVISAMVTNTGGSEGSHTVILKINGVEEARKAVTLGPDGSETVTFAIAKDAEGSYTVDIDGEIGLFNIAPPPVAGLPAEPARPVNWALIGGIIGGVLVVILALWLAVFRRRFRHAQEQ